MITKIFLGVICLFLTTNLWALSHDPYWEANVDSNTLALYNFNDLNVTNESQFSTSNQWKDVTANYDLFPADQTPQGTSKGKFEQAISFWTLNNWFLANDTLLDVVSLQGTVGFWFRPEEDFLTNQMGVHNFFGKYNNAGGPPEEKNKIVAALDYHYDGLVFCGVRDGTGWVLSSSRNFYSNQWYYTALTWGEDGLELWLGEQSGNIAIVDSDLTWTNSPMGNGSYDDFRVGSCWGAGSSGGAYAAMDDFQAWNTQVDFVPEPSCLFFLVGGLFSLFICRWVRK